MYYDQTQVQVLCFHYLTDNFDFLIFNKKNKINHLSVILIFLFEKTIITGSWKPWNDDQLFSNLLELVWELVKFFL
jgi:hypothetical protein